jgi:hypothetical protein
MITMNMYFGNFNSVDFVIRSNVIQERLLAFELDPDRFVDLSSPLRIDGKEQTLPSVNSVCCIPTQYLKWLLSSRIGCNENLTAVIEAVNGGSEFRIAGRKIVLSYIRERIDDIEDLRRRLVSPSNLKRMVFA